MPLSAQTQDDFGGGIYSGRKAPADTVYDIVNGLINDEGLVYRRGGSAYYSSSAAPAAINHMIVGYMRAPSANRVILSTGAATYLLDGSLAPVASATSTRIASRPAAIGNYLVYVNNLTSTVFYAGSLKSAQYTTGTVSVTNGSANVTGAGTAWLANADAGMLFFTGSSTVAVKSVTDNTHLVLTDPWPGSTAAGAVYELDPMLFGLPFGFGSGRPYVAAAGAGSPRLLYGIGNRVYFTDRGDPFGGSDDDYHEMPANAFIVGMEGRGDSAWVFTTAGVWSVGNLAFDPIDAFGNVQHTVEQISKDVILWDDFGIAGFAGGLVLPCVDDVFVATADFSLTPITGRIRPKYRAYVKAGYQPGQAAVHRGHYILPILNGTSLVDVLVCRLDRGAAWTTWAGHAAGVAYATLTAEVARAPKLLGLAGLRVTDLTGCFDPGTSTDADGTNSDFSLTTRDYPTGASQPGVAHKIRARYELASSSAATVAVAYSSDQDAGSFTTLTSRGGQNGTAGWSDSDGSLYQWANVGKKRERIRFKLTVAGACTRFVLRSVELLTRPSGKQ